MPTNHQVIGYSGCVVELLGEVSFKVTHSRITLDHEFMVVKPNAVNLFGRDLCKKFNM